MIEGHVFVDAYFTDADRTVCESLWYSAEEDKYRNYVVVAEEGDAEWERFLKHPIDNNGRTVTLEDLYERTYIRFQEQRQEIKEVLKTIHMDDEELRRTPQDNMVRALNDIFSLGDTVSEEERKENLFLLKLAVFEWDGLKSVDATFKKNIRKSKSAAEVMSLISDHLK